MVDPTLDALGEALEAESASRAGNAATISGGIIGRPCSRNLFYNYRWAKKATGFPASTLLIFANGHSDEDIMAGLLRKVPGVELKTHEANNRQIKVLAKAGHVKGYLDGEIIGLLQAPKTMHVWEHKTCNESKFDKLTALKIEHGEKQALELWDEVYYAQAIVYMELRGHKRHYMTVSTPGVRKYQSVRTDANPARSKALLDRAEGLVKTHDAPPRISEDPQKFVCRFCDFRDVCFEGRKPDRNCRTCLHSTPVDGGKWRCEKHDSEIDYKRQQQGCSSHLMLPTFVPGEVIDAGDTWVKYRLQGGKEWVDGE